MAFECSFSPEFWLAEGEPYDRAGLALNKNGKPISVFSAICKELNDPEFRTLVCDAFELAQNLRDDTIAEFLLDNAQEANTCANLTTPTEVYLDDTCTVSVFVWDNR